MKEIEDWEELRKGYEEVQMVKSSIENAYPEAYRLARKFHELYEETAPGFGYITNPNTREFYPNSNNARLMAYVCHTIVQEELEAVRQSSFNEGLKRAVEECLKFAKKYDDNDDSYYFDEMKRDIANILKEIK